MTGRAVRNSDPDGVAILVAVGIGVLAARLLGPAVVPVAVGAAVALSLLVWCWRGRDGQAGVLVLGLLMLTATAVTGARMGSVANGVLPRLADARTAVTVEGTVASEPRPVGYGARVLTLTVRRVAAAGRTWHTRERASVLLSREDGPATAGDRLRLRARALPSAYGDPLGWSPTVELAHPRLLSRTPSANPALHVSERIRAAARDEALERLPPERAGLLVAMALGDTSLLRGDLEDAFRTAGMLHLVAVSGANVAAILAAGLGLAFLLGAGRPALLLVGLPLIAAFAVLTRWEPSVLRASAMAALALVGLAIGFAPGGRRALCLAASILLLVAPALGASLGFALSVAATAGVLWLGPRFARLLPARVPSVAAVAAGGTFGAQAAVVPVLALTTGTLAPAGIPANLLAVPAAAGPMLLGVAAAVLAPVAPLAAGLICTLASPLLGYLIGIARLAERFGAEELTLTAPARGLCLVLWVLGVVTVVRVGRDREEG